MLKANTLASIAKLMKTTPEALTAAIKEEKEVDLLVKVDDKDVPWTGEGLEVLTTAELTTRDEQKKNEGKSGHVTAGKEIAIKELKEATGIEFTGKDPKKFVDEFKAKVLADAKISVPEQLAELNKQIEGFKKDISDRDTKLNETNGQLATAQLNSRILASLPKNRNPAISDNDYLLLINARIKAETVDGKEVIKGLDGEPIRDPKLHTPLALDKAIETVFTGNESWTVKEGKDGRGGGGSGGPKGGQGGAGGKPMSYTEAVEEWTAEGKSINTADFQTRLSKLAEDKAFVMDIPGYKVPEEDASAAK